MKRSVLFLTLVIVALCAFATPPNLSCETIFGRKDIRKEGHKVVSVTGPGNYYRSVSSDNDPQLRDDIIKLVEKDKKRAFNVYETYENGKEKVILNIKNNEQVINVGLTWNEEGYINLFIQGPPEAFE
ncbi:MAG: hypothetical protein K2M07_07370 [Muribaculaceae bacterium]|nr:hypothetical protein [Muribaculaceae bacterium]